MDPVTIGAVLLAIVSGAGTQLGTQVPRRLVPAEPGPLATSWNIFRMCLAPSGVPAAVANTLPVSCHPIRQPPAQPPGPPATP